MAKTGRKPTHNLKDKTCPNPACELYGKTGMGNIIANGTIKARSGDVRQRFLCTVCRGSFCSRTGTIFYDLRSSEEKVLLALKLLVKGMSIRGVAETIGVSADTVSRWLTIAAEHCEEVNQILLSKLKVSKVELDALWTFVKKNSLRQRGMLWKERSGLGWPLYRSIG